MSELNDAVPRMRVIIDLQICQSEFVDIRIRREMLRLAHGIVDSAELGDVGILLGDRAAQTIEPLRREFAGLDKRQCILVVCCAGLSGQRSGQRIAEAAAAVIREAVIEGRRADVVVVPMGFIDRGDVVIMPTGKRLRESRSACLWFGGMADPITDSLELRGLASASVASAESVFVPPGADEMLLHELGVEDARIRRLASDAKVAGSEVLAWQMGFGKRAESDPLPDRRRRLAFVSPMPPERTGVATYNAKLLPPLSEYYDIDVVTDQANVDIDNLPPTVQVRSTGWFVDRFDEYDRVLYHMGNSMFHVDVASLVRDYPGTVVMHDVGLGDLVNWLDTQPQGRGQLYQRLIEGHGFGAARMLRHGTSRGEIVRRFACSDDIVDEANGVIVHSAYAASLMPAHRTSIGSSLVVAALCREVEKNTDRLAARRRLNIPAEAFVVSSFGFINHIKMLRELVLAWISSTLSNRPHQRLMLVGGGHGNRYHQDLDQLIRASPVASRIVMTGYVNETDMADYYAATDIAVQLRSESRGESSGAALDCLAYGLPLITNGCGALGEFPDDVAIRLPIDFDTRLLAATLERLEADPVQRQKLSHHAIDYVIEQHAPRRVAQKYAGAIEGFARDGPRARYSHVLGALVDAQEQNSADQIVSRATAQVVAANLPRPGPSRLYVDITPLVETDLRTGIERVTRATLSRLIDSPPNGMRIEAVRFQAGRFVLARRFMSRWLDLPDDDVDREVEPRAGDVFLGLAWSPTSTPLAHNTLRQYRDLGVHVAFVVYDLLPQQHPEWFPPGVAQQHLGWLNTCCAFADRLICISAEVAKNLKQWLEANGPERSGSLAIAHFPLGSDIESSVATQGLPDNIEATVESLRLRPTFLMVGTVEPRKGHRQAIEAFDELWREGVEVGLAIVGKRGWMTEEVEALIAGHPEHGHRLIRVDEATDELLGSIYGQCAALLAASQGEGFGLPIIEAARHGIPVIARDLPVFREVAGNGAHYFSGDSPRVLANAVRDWLAMSRDGFTPNSSTIRCADWAEATERLVAAVNGESDFCIWEPPRKKHDPLQTVPIRCAIDFAKETWPREVISVSGLSGAEEWGRWSDANVGPTISLGFSRPLPRRATLRITARAFGPNCGLDAKIRIGDACYAWAFGAVDSTVDFDVATDGSQFALEIVPPKPTAPLEVGLPSDARRLGVGLVRLEIR
jgi:glycosyltransferase involved in cell wall biosynthesis